MLVVSIGFVAELAVPAFHHRLGWSHAPLWAVVFRDALTAVGFYIVFTVYRVNRFSSATIEVARDQQVVWMPPALGSWWGLAGLAAAFPAVVWRLLDEEKFLRMNLPGYSEYCARVRWRLVPRVF